MHAHDAQFMQLALAQARLALANNWIPVGAVFVRNERVIAHGTKNGMLHPLFDHAEHNGCYQALWSREGPKNLRGVTVYSTLEPCLMCASILMTTRVSRIVYGLADPYGGGAFMLAYPARLPERFKEDRPAIEGGVLAEESKALLREFFLAQESAGHWADRTNALVALALA